MEVFERVFELDRSLRVDELPFRRDDDPAAIERACRLIVCPLHDQVGVAGILAASSDVTDQVLARRLAMPSNRLLWSGCAGEPPDYFNAQWTAYTGQPESMASHDWLDAVHAEDRAQVDRMIADTGAADRDLRLRRSDGSYQWHRLRVEWEEQHGRRRWYASGFDIQDHRDVAMNRTLLLGTLRAALVEAEHANLAKDRFFATISHELRAPLTTIMLWEGVLREHVEDSAVRARALDAIRDSAALQSRLVGDLLDLSRAISGKLSINLKRVFVEDVLAGAVDGIRPAALARQLALDVDIAPPTARTRADAARLRQVFDNLLSNAVKFTPPGGSIWVKSRQSGSSIVIEIRDTGRGIIPEFLPKLFVPFSQNEDVLTRSDGGLGLGLAIAQQLVQLHGGTLSAFSEGVGRGTTLTVTLPIAVRQAPSITGSPSPVTPTLDGKSVLVVEDDTKVQDALALLLGRLGTRILTASSAESARALLQRETADVILCDIGMPQEDGYRFIRTLRASSGRSSAIPAIALTAYASEEDRRQSADAGFDAHVAKPVDLETLAQTIAQVLAARGTPA
jgi:signal transduction histidine kinase/ActR/RegA family two-component response regulator